MTQRHVHTAETTNQRDSQMSKTTDHTDQWELARLELSDVMVSLNTAWRIQDMQGYDYWLNKAAMLRIQMRTANLPLANLPPFDDL